MADSERTQGMINEILSIIGRGDEFNLQARKYFESIEATELTRILAGSRAVLNLARRHTISAKVNCDPIQVERALPVGGAGAYARLTELKEISPDTGSCGNER